MIVFYNIALNTVIQWAQAGASGSAVIFWH